MKKKKLLSMILALVMVFSLLPMSAFAAGNGSDTGAFAKKIKPRPTPSYPAQTLTEEVDSLTVTVDAPKGALPWGVEMNVTKISNLDAVQAAVDALEGVDGVALVAADITFSLDGVEIQPKKDVTVTMQAKELQNKDDLTVVHLDASAEELQDGEDADAEPVEGVNTDELNAVTSRSLYNGSAMVILRAGQTAGPVTLTITPEGGKLKAMKVKMRTE